MDRELTFILRFRSDAARAISRLSGNFRQLGAALERVQRIGQRFGRQLTVIGDRASQIGRRIREVGSTVTLAFSGPIAAAAGGAVAAFVSFEQALAGVAKTVDASEATIQAIGRQFVELSNQIPVSANELARLGEIAGQLGIETDNIVEFTEVVAKLGVATDLSSEQAAFALARFAEVVGTSQGQIDNLAASIVGLGNRFAATESEITEISLRIAGAGRVVGLTEGEILGLGTALTAVGVRAQAGGTSISRTLTEIAQAVNNGTEELRTFASVAGLSVQEFSTLFRQDAAEAVTRFIEGLEGVQRSGGNVFNVLEQLGITERRQIDALLRLSGASDTLRKAIAVGNEEFERNIALNKEAERFFATLGNAIRVVRNQLFNAAAAFGRALEPAVRIALERVSEFATFLQGMAERLNESNLATKLLVAGLLAAGAALGPLIVAFGSFTFLAGETVRGIGFLVQGFSSLVGLIPRVTAAVTSLNAALLINPYVLIAASIAAIVAALVIFRNETVRVGGETARVGDFVVATWELIRDSAVRAFEAVSATINQALAGIRAGFEALSTALSGAFEGLAPLVGEVFADIGSVFQFSIDNIIRGFQLLALVARTQFAIIGQLASNAAGIIRDAFGGLRNLLSGVFEAFRGVFGGVFTFVGGIFDRLGGVANRFFGAVRDGLADISDLVPDVSGALRGLDAALADNAESGNLFARIFQGVPGIVAESVDEANRILTTSPTEQLLGEIGRRAGERFRASNVEEIEKVPEDVQRALEKVEDVARVAGGQTGTTFGQAIRDGIRKGLEEIVLDTEELTDEVAGVVTSTFGRLEEGVLDFLATGKFNFREFALDVAREFDRLLFRILASEAVKRLQNFFQPEQVPGVGVLPGGAPAAPPAGPGGLGGGVLNQILGAITGGTETAQENAQAQQGLLSSLGERVRGLGDRFVTSIQGLGNLFRSGLDGLGGIFQSAFQGLGGLLTSGLSGITGALGSLASGLGGVLAGGGSALLSGAGSLAAAALPLVAGFFSGGLAGSPSGGFGLVPAGMFENAQRFQRGGIAGRDSIPAMIAPNEAVVGTVQLPGGARGIPVTVENGGTMGNGQVNNVTINLNVTAKDADSFRESEAQLGARVAEATERALRRNGRTEVA